jgi:hypothetical protein
MYCLPPAGVLHSQNKVIKCAAYGVTIMNGWVGGFAKVDNVFLRLGGFAKVDNVFLRLGGFAKVDNRFGYEKWT